MRTSSNAITSAWQAYDKRGKPLGCQGWEVSFDGVGAVQYQPVLAGHNVVAFAVARSPNPFATLSTDHARQIAAAPDLLRSLRELVDVCRRMECENDDMKPTEGEYQLALESGALAIYRATGERP